MSFLARPDFHRIIALYSVCVLIWGSTWMVITAQIDSASPIAAVFYRFILATAILFAFGWWTGRKMIWERHYHLNFALQGICNFSINFMLTYWSETMAPSGMVALTFTVLIYLNMIGLRIFFGRRIGQGVIVGAILGAVGMGLLFIDEIRRFDPSSPTAVGLLIALVGAFFASAGNMLSYRNHLRQVSVTAGNAWGMFYGLLFTGLCGLVLGQSLTIPLTAKFLGAMTYLALFGTVIAFGAYMDLVGRIGAEKAAYTSILSPVIALILSSLLETFHWTPWIVLGLICCFAGNIIALRAGDPPIKTA